MFKFVRGLTKKSYSVYYVKFVNNTTKEIHAQVDHIYMLEI